MGDFFNKEDKMLLANVLDKYRKYIKTGESTNTNFLNSEKLKMVENFLKSRKIPYSVYDKYPFLEKKYIYFGEYEDIIDFYKVEISDSITHSNILGTLFSLGISDDLIGDIIVEDGYFYYTSFKRMYPFLESNFVKIKNEYIKLERISEIVLNKDHFLEFDILVSSLRADVILSRITNCSRRSVNQMIIDKNILLNYKVLNSSSLMLKENDILSIRHYGKYKIGNQKGFTKKDNIILEIIKYV